MKFILAKHEGLFEHVKKFHVKHLQEEILKQYTQYSDDESIEMDDEEPIDTDAEQSNDDDAGFKNTGGLRPHAIKRPAQSVDESRSRQAYNKKKSIFARPSSMKWKQKLSMPNMQNKNNDDDDDDGRGGVVIQKSSTNINNLAARKSTLGAGQFRSSRYVLSQQRGGGGGGGMSIGPMTSLGGPKKIKKQRSDAPAIIQPKNYNQKRSSRLSQKRNSRLSNKNNKPHHVQQSTDIDGWENVNDNDNDKNNMKIMSLGQNRLQEKDSVTTPLKEEEVDEMAAIIDDVDDSNDKQ